MLGNSTDILAIRLEAGVWGIANEPFDGFCRESETGVRGKGIAGSLLAPFKGLKRVFEGVFERVGDGGHVNGDEDDANDLGDLGERDTRRWVRADCLGGERASGGKLAIGTRGT